MGNEVLNDNWLSMYKEVGYRKNYDALIKI
jgi:hypothetical protein